MSRATLILLAVLVAEPAFGQRGPINDPHMNVGVSPGGCSSCHSGHGASRSPMLPAPQRDVCLGCHGSQGDRDRAVARGHLSGDAQPVLLEQVLTQPYPHPISPTAYSRHDSDEVTCSSCHSPHRSSNRAESTEKASGIQRISSRAPQQLEYQLCSECHGSQGASTQSLTDISRFFTPENRSFHPVMAPATESSPSVIPALAGRDINCTDCHGNSNPSGPRGPHGSAVPYLLRWRYETTDGSSESPTSYELCYKCHRREVVLKSPTFPYHEQHIVGVQASCATCHNPHGSVENRALIGFGEETTVAGVAASGSTGELRFVSDGPGSGACYLTCHTVDHGPETYGSMEFRLQLPSERQILEPRRPSSRKPPTRARPKPEGTSIQ